MGTSSSDGLVADPLVGGPDAHLLIHSELDRNPSLTEKKRMVLRSALESLKDNLVLSEPAFRSAAAAATISKEGIDPQAIPDAPLIEWMLRCKLIRPFVEGSKLIKR